MKLNDMFPKRFFNAEDFRGSDRKHVYVIAGVEIEELGPEKQRKPVVSFRETEKSLALNKTNANAIAALFGEDSRDWIGKPIELFATRVPYKGKLVDSVGVRAPAGMPVAFDDEKFPTGGDSDIPF